MTGSRAPVSAIASGSASQTRASCAGAAGTGTTAFASRPVVAYTIAKARHNRRPAAHLLCSPFESPPCALHRLRGGSARPRVRPPLGDVRGAAPRSAALTARAFVASMSPRRPVSHHKRERLGVDPAGLRPQTGTLHVIIGQRRAGPRAGLSRRRRLSTLGASRVALGTRNRDRRLSRDSAEINRASTAGRGVGDVCRDDREEAMEQRAYGGYSEARADKQARESA